MKISNPFGKYNPELRRCEDIVRRIEKKYREHLLHKGTWLGKTAMLDVLIVSDSSQTTNGYASRHFCGSEVRYKIRLFINTRDSTRRIAYVIAHEFAHMLFSGFHDHIEFLEHHSGTLAFGSSMRRYISDTWEHYGQGMEEAAADLAAMYILSHCRFPDEDGSCAALAERENGPEGLASLGRRFAEIFGEPLDRLPYLDAFTSEEIHVHEGDPLYEKLEDVLLQPSGYRSYYDTDIPSPFWYAAATCSYTSIIDLYESHMGEGSYRELCRDIDYVHFHYREHDKDPQYVLDFRRSIAADLENMGMKPETEPETTPPADPESVRTAYRRAMEAMDRFDALYNAPDPEEESVSPDGETQPA